MRFTTVNETTLLAAANAVVGPEDTKRIIALYTLLDMAMKDGYDIGKLEAEQDVEARLDEAFDNGFEEGAVSVDADSGWDRGYISGVDDARRDPALADDVVSDIITLMMEAHYDDGGPYNEANVSDSSDETELFPERGYSIP